jgi:hypothetical protein
MRNRVFDRMMWTAYFLVLCCGVSQAAANASSQTAPNASSAQVPPEFRSAISKAIGLDQSLYHGEVIRNGYRMQNRGWGERQSSPAGGYASAVVGQGGPYGLKDTGTVMTSEGQRQLRPMSSPTAWSIGAAT